VIIVGESSVGKTSMLRRYIKEKTEEPPLATVGIEFFTRVVPTLNGKQMKINFYDTAGQECFQAITVAHYRKSMGAILVYSINSLISFQRVEVWLRELEKSADPMCSVVVVGNKADLPESEREVSTEEA